MRFVRENGKFYAIDKPYFRKELTFRELTLAMSDIALLVETHVTVAEDLEKYGPKVTDS